MPVPTDDQDRRAKVLADQHESLVVTPPVMDGGHARATGIDNGRPTWRYVIAADGSLKTTKRVK